VTSEEVRCHEIDTLASQCVTARRNGLLLTAPILSVRTHLARTLRQASADMEGVPVK
jgi:hypothetical protein